MRLTALALDYDGTTLGRSDFSRWISDVFGDRFLASQIARVEERYRLGEMCDTNDALATLISERYEVARVGVAMHETGDGLPPQPCRR